MDEYIKREEVLSRIYATHSTGGFANEEAYLWIHDEITNLSAADVQLVKYGRWIENSDLGQNINEHYMCSECGCTFHNWANDNYCPNCGSKNRMDGDINDEP